MIQFTSQKSEALRFPFDLDNPKNVVEAKCFEVDAQYMDEIGRPLKLEEFAEPSQFDELHYVIALTPGFIKSL